jgi:hypothetical protein
VEEEFSEAQSSYILIDMSDAKIFVVMLAVVVVAMVFWGRAATYLQATGVFPQVISCIQENPPQWASDKDWQPTLRVDIEPVRRSEGGGRIREYRLLGCRFYYYHGHFR